MKSNNLCYIFKLKITQKSFIKNRYTYKILEKNEKTHKRRGFYSTHIKGEVEWKKLHFVKKDKERIE